MSQVVLVSRIFCKFFVLTFRQKIVSCLTTLTTLIKLIFWTKMGQKQLNFLHWLHWVLKNYLFFLMFRNLSKMQNQFYRSYLPKILKILGNKYNQNERIGNPRGACVGCSPLEPPLKSWDNIKVELVLQIFFNLQKLWQKLTQGRSCFTEF